MAKFRMMIDERNIKDPKLVKLIPELRRQSRMKDCWDIFYLSLASLIGFVAGLGM